MENLFNNNMKKLTLTSILVIVCIFCFAQYDCSKFRTGKFQYTDSSKVVTIKRTRHIQEELVVNTGMKTRFKIHWVGDCVYEIKQIWANRKAKRKMNGSITKVNIIKAYDDRYDYTCACKDSASINKNRGTIFLIK